MTGLEMYISAGLIYFLVLLILGWAVPMMSKSKEVHANLEDSLSKIRDKWLMSLITCAMLILLWPVMVPMLCMLMGAVHVLGRQALTHKAEQIKREKN